MNPNTGTLNRLHFKRYPILATTILILAPPGCAHHAKVELSAATTIDKLVAQVETALTEYHDELEQADRAKRAAAIDAFVNRIRTDHADEQRTTTHVSQFNDALDHILADVAIEQQRHIANRENIRTMREVAANLRKFAIESMTLNDEFQRYVKDLIQPAESASPVVENESPRPTKEKNQ